MNIIITGLGHSGTMWLATFLSRFNSADFFAGHELLVYNFQLEAWNKFKAGQFNPDTYWPEYYEWIKKISHAKTVVDVDSFMRFFVDGYNNFPGHYAKVGLLVRNPLDVVRSFRSDLIRTGKVEKEGDFQNICRDWDQSTAYVLERCSAIFRLGYLLTEFSEIQKLAEWVGLEESEIKVKSVWEEFRMRKINDKKTYPAPGFSDWTIQEKRDIFAICGETMRKVGYFK